MNRLSIVHHSNSNTTKQPSSKRRLNKDSLSFGTWNVRTLRADGKLRELVIEMDRLKWNVLGLSEVRWIESGEHVLKEGHKLWYSGEKKYHRNGVGILVHKDHVSTVMSYEPVSSRIMTMRINTLPRKLTIIQVYAPTSDHPDEEVEEFYEKIDIAMKNIPKEDIVIIQGDWNAKIGTDAYENWFGTAGRYGLGTTN